MSVMSSSTTTAESVMTQTPEVDLNMSLDRFQAKYTSEDNESFNRLLDKQNLKRAEKYRWLWAGNKIPAARQIKQREREGKLLQARLEQEKEDGGKPRLLIEGPDERKAMPDTWEAKPNNQVFFAPDSVEDEYETVQQTAEAKSRAAPKAVVYGNTRLSSLQSSADIDPLIPPSPSISAIQDAIAGRPRATDSEPGYSGAQTPRVNGYAFVDDEPTVAEEEAVAVVAATAASNAALLLGSGDATPNPFKIKEQSKRESLHHRMVDRVARNNRSRARRTLGAVDGTPTPRFGGGSNSPKTGGGNLTPAAQKLLSRVASPRNGGVGLFEGRAGSGMKGKESGLRYRWTPTPKVQKGVKE